MSSYPRPVSGAVHDRVRAIFDRAEASAGSLSTAEVLEAIARAARLDAVLRARHAALEAAPRATAAPESPRYLGAGAAADYLGVSKSTVLRLAKTGTIRALRPSEGVVRFDRADLDAYMTGAKE